MLDCECDLQGVVTNAVGVELGHEAQVAVGEVAVPDGDTYEEGKMTSSRAYRIAAVLLAWLVPGGLVPGFAETGEDRIYWADMEGIYWSDLEEGTTQRIIAADTRRPGKIAVDVAGGKIYWVDKRGETIQWSDLDGSNSEVLVGFHEWYDPDAWSIAIGHQARVWAVDLDLDLERRKLYFSALYNEGDVFTGGVYRSNLDGSEVEYLGIAASPTLAVDPVGGEMYLSNWDSIYRLDQDGSNLGYALTGAPPGDIALDLVEGKVYWTAPGDRAIRRSNPDGSEVEDVLTELEDTPGEIALDLEGGKVYWTLLHHYESYGGLLRANFDGSEVEYVVEQGEVVGFTLDLKGSKVYWTDARGTIQRADLDGSNPEDLFAPLVRAPYALALDATDGGIYWTDLLAGTVQRSGLDGSGHEILVGGLDVPKGVCLGGGRIYWADSAAGKIQSADLDGSDPEVIASDLHHPDKVALDLAHGRIYWTERDKRLINRVHLDGSNVEGFSVNGYPQGIALDVSEEKMYWTWSGSEGTTGISRSSLEGTDVEDLVAGGAYYNGYRAIALDVVGGKIHWITMHTPPTGDNIHYGPNAYVWILRADLDGSKYEEVMWIPGAANRWYQDMWYQPGLKVDFLEALGNALALDLSRRTAVSAGNSAPLSTTLRSSYPNPFNGSTLISYTLAAPGPVTLVVYNTLGQPVQTLVERVQSPGTYSVPWQARGGPGQRRLLYRLTTPDAVLTRRLALVR